MIGVPQANLQRLLKEHHERDPLVKQSLLETAAFIKVQEGYPQFFNKTEQSNLKCIEVLPGSSKIGILDIYESLS